MKFKKFLLVLLSICFCIPAIFLIPSYIWWSPGSGNQISSFSLQNLANNNFQDSINNSLAQHIIGKQTLRRAKTQMDIWMGKQESDDIYISGNTLIQKSELPNEEDTDKILGKINDFSSKVSKPVYLLLIPSSAEVNKDKLPPHAPRFDEISWINSCYENLPKQITTLDAVTALSSAKNAQMYYRTDTRLTSLGAYYIYNFAMKNMGFISATLQDFNIQYATRDFYGSLYQKILPSTVQPDHLDLYHYNNRKIEASVTKPSQTKSETEDKLESSHNEIYFRDYLNTENGINVFLGKPSGVTKIKTNSGTGKKLLVFGDENIGTFSQFLILHYDEIDIVNLNEFKEKDKSLIKSGDYDTILFEYETTSLNNPEAFSLLDTIN